MAFNWTPYTVSPVQDVEGETSSTTGLLFQVGPSLGSPLYFVSSSEVGTTQANDNVWIMKSLDGGVTWQQVYNGPKQAAFPFVAVLAGTVIYIFNDESLGVPLYRFDTMTDTFLPDAPDPGIRIRDFSGAAGVLLSDGTILFAYVGNLTLLPSYIIYNPSLNSWGSEVVGTNPAGSGNVGCVGITYDPVSNLAFNFLVVSSGTDKNIYCVPVSFPLAENAAVIAAAFSTTDFIYRLTSGVGRPCISGGDVCLPYVDPDFNHAPPGILHVVRAAVSTTPIFGAPETVTAPALPLTLWTLAPELWSGWYLLDVSGLLYCFYTMASNNLDNAATVASLRYRTSSTPGVWSSESIAWTGPLPSSPAAPYPLLLNGGDFGVIMPFGNPVLFFTLATKYASFATVFLRSNPAPVVTPSAAGSSLGGASGARFKPCSRFINEFLSMQAAEELRQARAKKREWPYAHLFPVESDIPVNQIADIPAPAVNVVTPVLEYRVPSGFRFWMHAILQDGPASFLPGDALWTVDINSIVPNTSQATKVQGLIHIPLPLGSVVNGEYWKFYQPYLFEPLTVIRSTVVNVNFSAGAPNIFTSGFFGFLVPVVN